jgi:hypothetical protein
MQFSNTYYCLCHAAAATVVISVQLHTVEVVRTTTAITAGSTAAAAACATLLLPFKPVRGYGKRCHYCYYYR